MSFRLEHRIGVAAPASVIWGVIADLEAWAAWNPLHTQAQGVLRIGERLKLAQQVPGEAVEIITPVVIDWVPDAQLIWAGKYGGGLARSKRYLEIEALSETGCIFSNGEVFEGLGAGLIGKGLRRRLRGAFGTVGEAVKARAEAAYATARDPAFT